MRRIIAIDPALTKTGYAVVEANERGDISLLEGGIVTTKPSDSLERRLAIINRTLTEIIDEFNPNEMAIEDLHSRYRNLKTAIVMAHARGVALLTAGNADIGVHNYEPTRIKTVVAGSGRADKDQVMRAVNMRLALPNPITQTDVADAIGIAICHVQLTLNDATVKAVALTKQTAQA